MNLIVKRRRFGQMAIASAATTAIANLAGKTMAQQSESVIYGFNLGSTGNTILGSTTNAISDKADLINLGNSTGEMTVTALNPLSAKVTSTVKLVSKTVENQSIRVETDQKAVSAPKNRLTSVTPVSNGGFIVCCVVSSRQGDINRLSFVESQSSNPKSLSMGIKRGLKISGFTRKNSTVESLLLTKENQLISVISHYGGLPPFEIVLIDLKTGRIRPGAELNLPDLPSDQRLSNLTLAPNGKFYATILDRENSTTLVQLDPQKKSILTGRLLITKVMQLNYNNEPLVNDLLSLTFSPSGQLFALANPKNEKNNSMFKIDINDVKAGKMQLIGGVSVNRISFAR
jgi:hypothetical protein